MTDRQELKRLAEAAYGAKFQTEGFEQTDGRGQHYGGLILHENGHTIIASCVMQPWADFIAAANPAAILALIAENERMQSAGKTLEHIGYTDNGGELWKPPLGTKPDFDLIDELRTENDALLKDAERYRAIRDEIPHGDLGKAIVSVNDAAEYDAAIDAAMGEGDRT